MLRQPPHTWDLEAMYARARGGPVAEVPTVYIVRPEYRESIEIKRQTEPSLVAVENDLLEHGIQVMRADVSGDSLVMRMRQIAQHHFLLSPATHLLWWDLDIEARDPTCVRRMLGTGYDVVAGACPYKRTGGRVVCNLHEDDAQRLVGAAEGQELAFERGCLEVRDAGTGFLLVSRRAHLALQMAHPELLHWRKSLDAETRDEPLWALYDTGIVDGEHKSEDFMFCHRWQALGGKVYVDVMATFRHYGIHGYEGSLLGQYGLEVA